MVWSSFWILSRLNGNKCAIFSILIQMYTYSSVKQNLILTQNKYSGGHEIFVKVIKNVCREGFEALFVKWKLNKPLGISVWSYFIIWSIWSSLIFLKHRTHENWVCTRCFSFVSHFYYVFSKQIIVNVTSITGRRMGPWDQMKGCWW